jgi:6-phosphogluconate dehydrogenase
VLEAIQEDVPVNTIAGSLFARFASRQDDSFAMKVIAALRGEFGGHAIKEAATESEK